MPDIVPYFFFIWNMLQQIIFTICISLIRMKTRLKSGWVTHRNRQNCIRFTKPMISMWPSPTNPPIKTRISGRQTHKLSASGGNKTFIRRIHLNWSVWNVQILIAWQFSVKSHHLGSSGAGWTETTKWKRTFGTAKASVQYIPSLYWYYFLLQLGFSSTATDGLSGIQNLEISAHVLVEMVRDTSREHVDIVVTNNELIYADEIALVPFSISSQLLSLHWLIRYICGAPFWNMFSSFWCNFVFVFEEKLRCDTGKWNLWNYDMALITCVLKYSPWLCFSLTLKTWILFSNQKNYNTILSKFNVNGITETSVSWRT